jgi:hypothetical protein
MLITRKSRFSGKTNTMDLPVLEIEYSAWMNGVPAQTAFPNLSADQREFIISGTTPEEWAILFEED